MTLATSMMRWSATGYVLQHRKEHRLEVLGVLRRPEVAEAGDDLEVAAGDVLGQRGGAAVDGEEVVLAGEEVHADLGRVDLAGLLGGEVVVDRVVEDVALERRRRALAVDPRGLAAVGLRAGGGRVAEHGGRL